MDLIAQSQMFTSTSLSLDDLDQCLKEYVHITEQLNEFKYTLYGKYLSDTNASSQLLSEQLVSI